MANLPKNLRKMVLKIQFSIRNICFFNSTRTQLINAIADNPSLSANWRALHVIHICCKYQTALSVITESVTLIEEPRKSSIKTNDRFFHTFIVQSCLSMFFIAGSFFTLFISFFHFRSSFFFLSPSLLCFLNIILIFISLMFRVFHVQLIEFR